MYLLFEETGKFLAGRVLSEADASSQVELASGKRVKVKKANALLHFEQPAPQALLEQAQALAPEIDLDLAWEFAPDEEFGFAEFARDYFSADTDLAHQVAALLRLYDAPHYFRRAGKGRFRKAPEDVLQQALAAIEKKRQQQLQIDAWAAELAAGQTPVAIREQLYKILFKPDKNAPEYKAVVEATRSTQLPPLTLLQRAGAIASAYEFHWQRFLFDQFPKGYAFPPVQAPEPAQDLPLAPVQAFSIDDSSTSEIDDALSVQGLGSGQVTLGIHIAAPGLAIRPGDALDQLARARLSTVYMPGAKLTMLPDEVVQKYTLEAGRANPALSLYVTYDEGTLEPLAAETRIERVNTAHNLRLDKIEHIVTAEWLAGVASGHETPAELQALQPQLAFLHGLAKVLKARREVVRGKPETFNRPDYNFRLQGQQGDIPDGSETVQISTRQRGAPLDLIVAEAMIVANSHWGGWLAGLGVPAIYRSQHSLAPGVKVRMGTKALPHAGMGVASYAWSTSPLRRYVDLLNQWQIIAAAQHGSTAALAAPFKPRDAELFSIISGFDAAYTAYNRYQGDMERFWTLRYLQQNGIQDVEATIIKDASQGDIPLVRADTLPLVLRVLGAQDLARGARVRVRLGEIDLIALEVSGTVTERLERPADAAGQVPLAANDAGEDEEEGEELSESLAIAVDMTDGGGNGEGSSDTAAPQGQQR
ncbi:RNB domain-containing ribonuclease [Corticibacter populi]|uniref:RNB domain-containing ribonuclease n=1 Tax=Corticibacter populi TaxID=1550736 RepID=A0A3M6QJB1_9BURK|nr:RNB domain-containing ribonuclease [Corticibacter populi]RMX02572.1 RNB domain-containing ribonuclease [Corticibacter populi]RZS33018.1 exoribonuclease-2 [Corticibacter populi]